MNKISKKAKKSKKREQIISANIQKAWRYIKGVNSGKQGMIGLAPNKKLLMQYVEAHVKTINDPPLNKLFFNCDMALSNNSKLNMFCNYINRQEAVNGVVRPTPIRKQFHPKWIKSRIEKLSGNDRWMAVRYQALKAGNGKCCLCGLGAHDGVKLHVDHIKPKSIYPELMYEVDNLQVLCEGCNMGKSNLDDTNWRDKPVKDKYFLIKMDSAGQRQPVVLLEDDALETVDDAVAKLSDELDTEFRRIINDY